MAGSTWDETQEYFGVLPSSWNKRREWKNLHTCDFFPHHQRRRTMCIVVVYGGCHEKVPWRKKKSPHHSRKKSRIFTLLLFLLRRRFEVKPRAEAQPAPPGFSFSGDLWQNFWSIHPYARPPFSPYMPTELWQKPNISYKGIEFLMPPLGWLVAGDF